MAVTAEQILEYKRRYRETHREQIREKARIYTRDWIKANPGYRRQYMDANRDRLREANRRYYENNLEKTRAASKKWRAANPNKGRESARRRRARLLGAEGSHSEGEWLMVLALYGGHCAYCGEAAHHRDHVVPISKGGSDGIENIVPACDTCNKSKSASYLWDWPRRPMLTR